LTAGPRSDLLRRVLGALRDHPHDNTVEAIAVLLTLPPETIADALGALREDGLVGEARGRWGLSRAGWSVARADDPYRGLE
jgi:DNA-binding IclR family transcriptional regulator